MEQGAINTPHERRQKKKMTLPRSETFPSMSHPQRAASGQAINQQESSSIPSFPTHLDQGASFIQQQPYVSNLESDSLTNHRQVANAGDASLQALGALLVKIQPSLSSLLQDLANWDVARSLPAPNFDKPQETCSLAETSPEELEQIDLSEKPSTTDGKTKETLLIRSSLNASTSQGGLVEINVEEPSPSEDFEYQTNGRNGNECAMYGPLVQACLVGDWPAAEAFLEKFPTYVRACITINETRALHIAVAHQHTNFVTKLLKLMRPEDLELQTKYGFTALHFAAQVGNVKIAELLVNIHNKAVAILDRNGDTPLIVAASLGRTNVASYLFSLSSTPLEQLNDEKRIELLLATISNDMYAKPYI